MIFFVYDYFYPRPVAEANSYSDGMMTFFPSRKLSCFSKIKAEKKKKFVLVGSRNLKREQGYSNNTVSLCSLLSQSRLKVKFYYTAVAAAAAVDVLWGQPIKLVHVIPTSELHKY